MEQPTCIIDGCMKPCRNKTGGVMCKMHYHRWYRHGDPSARADHSGITASLGRRYRTIAAKGHPVATAGGRAYEHRVVLYDEIGPGPHPCHWCATPLDWLPKGDPMCLMVDHLNGDGADNRPENLVPACVGCNSARGQQARSDALREAGFWSQHDTVARLRSQGRRPRISPAA